VKIYTLWHEPIEPGGLPWIVDAVDQSIVDENNGFPENYADLRARSYHREIIIEVPGRAILAAFESPQIKGTVKP